MFLQLENGGARPLFVANDWVVSWYLYSRFSRIFLKVIFIRNSVKCHFGFDIRTLKQITSMLCQSNCLCLNVLCEIYVFRGHVARILSFPSGGAMQRHSSTLIYVKKEKKKKKKRKLCALIVPSNDSFAPFQSVINSPEVDKPRHFLSVHLGALVNCFWYHINFENTSASKSVTLLAHINLQ